MVVVIGGGFPELARRARIIGIPARLALPPGPATVTRSGDGLRIVAGDGRVVADGWPEATFGSPTPITVGGRPYRGGVRVIPGRTGVRAVNVVSLEQYLPSVVAREMPPGWGDDAPAALRAQAIAARSYAIATASDRGDFDLYDDQRSQVYGGVANEDPRSTAAVTATRGQALTYAGDVIVAYYTSASGGHTEDGRNVFPSSTPTPYLTGVDDPYDTEAPLHRWPQPPAYTGRELGERLGLPLPVIRIEPFELGTSGRWLRTRVWMLPMAPSAVVDGPTLRAKLELPDTWIDVHPRSRMPGGGPAPLPRDADRAAVWLAVLNGSGRAGQAARTARRAEELGYRGVYAGNAPPTPGAGAVYAAGGAEAAARRAAADLGMADVRPLANAGAAVAEAPSAAHVIVVLGSG